MNPDYDIRPAQMCDLQHLPAIEKSAGLSFSLDPGLAFLAEDEPMSVEQHEVSLQSWRSSGFYSGGTWVATHKPKDVDSTESCVGFIVTSLESSTPLSNYIHIQELSVHVNHQRRGLASRLMYAVKEFAKTTSTEPGMKQINALTLITMRDISFNGPFYIKQGFQEYDARLLASDLGKWAQSFWEEDQNRFEGIKDRRCFMVHLL